MSPIPGPCMGCGACCAFFSVVVQDTDLGSGLPLVLTCFDNKHQRVMKGTQASHPRCAALQGVVSTRVKCSIYASRPAICRDFQHSWENGRPNPLCDRARAVYGLQSFSQY